MLPQAYHQTAAFFCSDPDVSAEQVLQWLIARWNIEVTFEEVRAHLGFETQRQWSDRAIERTTPGLFGLFSLVVVFATVLFPDSLPIRQAEWYPKNVPGFAIVFIICALAVWRIASPMAGENGPKRIRGRAEVAGRTLYLRKWLWTGGSVSRRSSRSVSADCAARQSMS